MIKTNYGLKLNPPPPPGALIRAIAFDFGKLFGAWKMRIFSPIAIYSEPTVLLRGRDIYANFIWGNYFSRATRFNGSAPEINRLVN